MGDTLEPAVGYMCVAACLGGPRGTLWSQLSGIREPAVGYRCLGEEDGVEGGGEEEEDGEDEDVGHLA